ncbi:ATP synthase subunit I [Polaromonas sp.]|uniref:ATP synthase subunit I n=1 Tax=Polaromonas sp. TaxID=1869339 RepID=UPI002FC90E07
MSAHEDKREKQEAQEEGDEGFTPLTREEAQKLSSQLSKANPLASPWRVLAVQSLAGCLVALLAWGLTGRAEAGWSALYGALSVVIPAALFARGMKRGLAAGGAGAAMAGFFFWEAVKIALTVAMLFAAPRLVASLSWLALVAGFVVTMKVVWVLLLFRPKRRPSDTV